MGRDPPTEPRCPCCRGCGRFGHRGTLCGRGEARPLRCAALRWAAGDERMPEVFVAGEGLAGGARGVLETLLHEAAHGLAMARQVSDTSRQGRYHNRRYRDLAAEVGLIVEQRPPWGWTDTALSTAVADGYQAELASLEAALTLSRSREPGRGKTTKTNPPPCGCRCEPPRLIRVAPATLALGPITCALCAEAFEPQDDR